MHMSLGVQRIRQTICYPHGNARHVLQCLLLSALLLELQYYSPETPAVWATLVGLYLPL